MAPSAEDHRRPRRDAVRGRGPRPRRRRGVEHADAGRRAVAVGAAQRRSVVGGRGVRRASAANLRGGADGVGSGTRRDGRAGRRLGRGAGDAASTPTAERADAWRGLGEALRVCRDATVASVVAQLAATTWEEDHDRAVERALPEAFAEAVRTLRRANHDDDHDHDHNDDDGELRNDAVLFTASTTIQTLRNTSV